MRFLAALSFLTIVPVPFPREATEAEVGGSPPYFPLVGLIIGSVLAGLGWVLGLVLPGAVVSVLLVAVLAAISGAMHLDGFADTCDGLAGHRSVEERLAVMRDSRAGAFGVVGVVLVLLVKYAALDAVPQAVLAATLLVVPMTSRWAMAYAIFSFPYARPSGLGKVFKQEARGPGLALAALFTLAVTTALAWVAGLARFYVAGLAVVGVAWLVAMAAAALLSRRFGGLTGDTYGFINEITEVSVLLLVAAAAHGGWL